MMLVERNDEMNENVKDLLNMFSNNGIEILPPLLKKRLEDQSCVQSLRNVHLSMPRKEFVAFGCTPFQKD